MSVVPVDFPPPAQDFPGRPQWTSRHGLLEIEVVHEGRRWLLALHGELDRSNVELLEHELSIAEAAEPEQVVLDLSGLEFLDSSGLRAVVHADRRSRRGGVRLKLVPGPRPVHAVFVHTGNHRELPFVEADRP